MVDRGECSSIQTINVRVSRWSGHWFGAFQEEFWGNKNRGTPSRAGLLAAAYLPSLF